MPTYDIISYLWTNVIPIRKGGKERIGLDSFVAITITINIDCLAGRHSQRVLKAANTHTGRHTSHAPDWTYIHTCRHTRTDTHIYVAQLKAVIVFAFAGCSRICDAFMFQLLPLLLPFLFYLLTLPPALFFSLTNKLTCHIAIATTIHKKRKTQAKPATCEIDVQCVTKIL